MAPTRDDAGRDESLAHSLALCRLEDIRPGVYLTDGEALIRVLFREAGIVWVENTLEDLDAPPHRIELTEICRSFRVVEAE